MPHSVTSPRASTTMNVDIFDSPSTRSTNRIGTSTIGAPGPFGGVGHLDLEAIALGPDGVEVEPGEQRGRVGPEAGGGIGDAESEEGRGVDVAGRATAAAGARPSLGITPPGMYREPMTSSLPSAKGATRDGSASGSWERSASISMQASKPRSSPQRESGPVGAAEARLSGPAHDLDTAQAPWPGSRPGRRFRRGCRRRPRARWRPAVRRGSDEGRGRCSRTRYRSGGPPGHPSS